MSCFFFICIKNLKFTVHHTCSSIGNRKDVLAHVPFHSDYIPEENKKPFLGEGFYFWEYNTDYAKFWGRNHYLDAYYICEAEVLIDQEIDGYYLDLAGNRKDLIEFVKLLKLFELIDKNGTKGIDLCSIISYLRNKCPDAFPFKVIRAVDYKNASIAGIKIYFNDKEDDFTILNPRIIIAYKEKKDILYTIEPFITFVSRK